MGRDDSVTMMQGWYYVKLSGLTDQLPGGHTALHTGLCLRLDNVSLLAWLVSPHLSTAG